MSNFRLNGKTLFLTYPRCDVPSDEAERIIRQVFNCYEWSIWGRELHADGTPHLHAIVQLHSRCDLRSPTRLDLHQPNSVVFHGDYRVARKPTDVLNYVIKDGTFRCYGITLDDARRAFATAGRKRSRIEVVLEGLNKGKSMTKIGEEDPELVGTIVLHGNKIEAFHNRTILESQKPSKKLLMYHSPNYLLSSSETKVMIWLNTNLKGQERPFGAKQLWIGGPTMYGKTTFIMNLMPGFRIYYVPTDEDYYDEYNDNAYDLIVFDEFKHQKTIQFMNRFVDGQVCPLKQKGKQTVKRKNLPVIVLSNYRMRECYHSVEQGTFDTLARRFEEIWLDRPIDITPVWENPETQVSFPSPSTSSSLANTQTIMALDETIEVDSEEEKEIEEIIIESEKEKEKRIEKLRTDIRDHINGAFH